MRRPGCRGRAGVRIRPVLAAVAVAVAVAGPAGAAPGPGAAVTCEACVVVDDSGKVLWARRPDARHPMASTTKMATALVVVGSSELGDEIRVSRSAAATADGGFPLEAGDRFEVRELLLALLLASSNEAAVALAEHVAGSEAVFVARMNELAEDLGATGTRFVTSHGLDRPGHYSTARDLAVIGSAALRDPVVAEIVATAEATISGARSGRHDLSNRNPLLKSYRGAIGVKTGYTLGAGNVLVAAARRNGRELIAVALRSEDAGADARALLDYGFARLRRGVLLRTDDPVGAVVFDSGSVEVVAGATVRGIAAPERVRYSLSLDPASAPPLRAGDRVGTVDVIAPGGWVETVDAVAAAPLQPHDRGFVAVLLELLLRLFGALTPGRP